MWDKGPSDCWCLSRDGALPRCTQGLSLQGGAGSVAGVDWLLAEYVVLPPECQFWMLRMLPQDLPSLSAALAHSVGISTWYSLSGEGELGQAGVRVSSHTQ